MKNFINEIKKMQFKLAMEVNNTKKRKFAVLKENERSKTFAQKRLLS